MRGLGRVLARLERLEGASGAQARDRGPVVVTLRSIAQRPVPMSWPELLAFVKGVPPTATGNRAALASAITDIVAQLIDGQADAGPHRAAIASAIARVKDGEPLEEVLRAVLPELVKTIDGDLARGGEHAPRAASWDEHQSCPTQPPPSGREASTR